MQANRRTPVASVPPILAAALAVALAVAPVGPAAAADGADDDPWTYDEGLRFRSRGGGLELTLTNRGQVRFTYTEPDLGDSKGSFDIARYKLKIDGRIEEKWEFGVQADLAGGSEAGGELLEDAFFRFVKSPMVQVWVGQGKVPFGRQQLTSSGKLQFVDRSIASARFAHGRDVGIALHGETDKYGYHLGVYNGDGINKDEGDNIDYLGVARLILTPLGPYELQETDVEHLNRDPDERGGSRLAIGVSAMANTTGTEGFEEERVVRGAFELAYKIAGFNLVAEFYTESADVLRVSEPKDEQDTDGWYFQAGHLFRNGIEIAGRHAEITRDADLTELFPESETESGLVLGYYLKKKSGRRSHGYKLQVDVRVVEFDEVGCADPALPPCPRDDSVTDRKVVRAQLQRTF